MSDLNIQVLGLLQFIEDTLQESIDGPSSLAECLSEADHALRILQNSYAKTKSCSPNSERRLSLICGFSEITNQKMATERQESINRCLGFVSSTKILLS